MNLEKFKNSCRKRVRNLYNAFIDLKPRGEVVLSDLPELNEIKERAVKRTAVNEHLVTLFLESLTVKPKLIVELGVGGGESTFVFARVARLCGSVFVSLDINDRSHVCSYEDWIFVRQDDIEFARGFGSWCGGRGIEPLIDVLFIDTSHYFDHTLEEIKAYFPFLSEKAKVFFHDTNLSNFFFRKDGSIDIGWDNERGVIRALEAYFQRPFHEKESFVDFAAPFIIRHHHYCCGLTILEKI
jgi:hypothetical protein